MKEPVRKSALISTVHDFMTLLKGLMLLVFIGFCFSGVTLVNPDEVGLIFRMGKLVGENRVDKVRQPGWIFALPSPVDQVFKIPVKQILEVRIRELAALPTRKDDKTPEKRSIDPIREGYCISADENIFQVTIFVKYQITDPVAAVQKLIFSFSTFEKLIQDFTVSEMVKVAARFNIDGVLSEDKKHISQLVKERVQGLLDKLETGLTVVSLEFEEISPPEFLKRDFEEVNTAFINRRNFINDARSLSEEKLPRARAKASEMLNQAEAYAESVLADATAEADKFSQILQAYLQNPEEVRMNMIDEGRKKLIGAMKKLVVLPPVTEFESGVRIFLGGSAGSPAALPFDSRQLYEEED